MVCFTTSKGEYIFIIQANQKGYEKFKNIDKLPNNLY